MPRPIYRYEIDRPNAPGGEQSDVSDGALFGFVEGTDLEVVLSLQARQTGEGAEWEYALARMSDFRLKVTLGDRAVWEVDRAGFDNPRVAYYCSTVESRTSP